jgi:hypothetical protein
VCSRGLPLEPGSTFSKVHADLRLSKRSEQCWKPGEYRRTVAQILGDDWELTACGNGAITGRE